MPGRPPHSARAATGVRGELGERVLLKQVPALCAGGAARYTLGPKGSGMAVNV